MPTKIFSTGHGKKKSGEPSGSSPAPASRHSGGTSGDLTVKGQRTQTPVLSYLPSEPSHIPGVAGATKSSARAVLRAQRSRRARSLTRRSSAQRKRQSTTSAKRIKQTEAAVKAAKPVKSAPKVSAEIKAPPAKLAKIRQAVKANAKEFAAEQPKAAKQRQRKLRPSFAIPQPKLSPTLQHPKATLRAEGKLKRARRVLARTTRRSDGSTEGAVKDALHKRGYNRVGAAGVIGNFKQESGPELNTTADDGSGNGGLAGFTASPVSKADLQAFAASHGLDWTNPRVQVAFMDQHVDPATKAAVNAAKSPQEAAVAFQDGFERPGIPMQGNRERYAVEAFQKNNLAKANPKAVRNYKAAVKKAESLGISAKPGPGRPPKQVVTRYKAAEKAAAQIEKLHLPYVWGGGHNSGAVQLGSGVDCSGAVSYVLQKMGVKLPGGVVSGEMGSYLKPGPGAITVFYNPEHTFMRIGNRYFGTSGSNPGGGAGFIERSVAEPEAMSGKYSVGHVAGLGQKVALQLGVASPDTQSFPGMSFSSSGTSATIESGAGATMNEPGFSSRPIKLTQTQKARRTFKRLKQAGIGVPKEAKEETSLTLKALERKYGAKTAA